MGHCGPRGKAACSKAAVRHRAAARSCTSELASAEASGLEHGARAGIRPIKSKPPVLASLSKGSSGNGWQPPRAAVARPKNGQASGVAGVVIIPRFLGAAA